MKTFQAWLSQAYALTESSFREFVGDGDCVLDLGCGSGAVAEYIDRNRSGCTVYCVDSDGEKLAELSDRKFPNTTTAIVQADAPAHLSADKRKYNVIAASASLHEFTPIDGRDQFLLDFFGKCAARLATGGKVIICDYYYSDDAPDALVDEYRRQQLKAIGHADPREKFVKPLPIKKAARMCGLKAIYSREERVVKSVDRRFYVLVFKKIKGG